MLTVIEKVFLLQDIDVFANTSTEDLAYIGAITEEVSVNAGQDLFKEGDAPDAMYIIIAGRVKLHKEQREVMMAVPGQAFGTWALFDTEPHVVTATAAEETALLKLDRNDFYDLLADHTVITQSVLANLSGRLRKLIERVSRGQSSQMSQSS